MTEKRRRTAAEMFRKLLDRGIHRKEAFRQVLEKTSAARRSIYRYCKEFRISTD